jgi:hypothetical protein
VADLVFDEKGNLYMSSGEGASYARVDYGQVRGDH